MAKKKVAAVVKIQIPAGRRHPAPPVGTALGPHGVAIMDFCKEYNAATEAQRGTIVPVEITIYEDRIVHVRPQDPADPGAAPPGGRPRRRARQTPGQGVGRLHHRCARSTEIAKIKMPDLNAYDLDAAKLQVAGTARSMGINVVLTSGTGHRTASDSRRPSPGGDCTSPAGRRPDEGAIMAKGKKYNDARRKRFDRDQLSHPAEAVDLVKSLATAKFDETVELAVRLGVDPRKADQMVRGTVALPSGTGKDVRVARVRHRRRGRRGPRAPGADVVGADDLAAEIEGGILDFDVAIATPDLMPLVGKLGRVLGPRGLMPNPKTGTVTTDVGKAVSEFKGGKVEYRTDRHGNVHVPIGKVELRADALAANFRAVHRRAARGPSRRRPRAGTSAR